MVQNWSEDDLRGAAETIARSISSVVAGQDRLAMGICKKYCSVGAYGWRKLLFAESNSIIIKIVALTKAAPFGYSGLSWILLTHKNMQETRRRESVLVRKEFLTQTSQGPEYMNTLGWGLLPPSLPALSCLHSFLSGTRGTCPG